MNRLLSIFVFNVFLLSGLAVVSIVKGVPISFFTKDTFAVTGAHPLTGLISNLGAFMWCAAATSCAVIATVIRHKVERKLFLFLLASSALSSYLLLDDFFMFHEFLAEHYLGVGEKTVFALLGLFVVGYLMYFRETILRLSPITLMLGMGFLGLSVVVDTIFEPWMANLGEWQYFIEDGAKWLGVSTWCYYYLSVSTRIARRCFDRSAS